MDMKKILLALTLGIYTMVFSQTPGNALNFDGANDMVVTNVPPLFGNLAASDFTFEAWVYPTGAIFSRIIYAQFATNNFATMSTGGTNNIYFYVIAGGTTYSIATTAILPSNQWTHVACRWTSSSLTPEVFFNGVLQAGVAGGGSSTGTNGLMTIGARPGGAQYFPGSLDEVRVWSEARTQCEIQANMNGEYIATQPTLVAYYNFNNGVAGGTNTGITTLNDINATYDGTLNNFALAGATSNWISSGALINQINSGGIISSSYSNTICNGDTVIFGGQPLFASGAYSDTVLTGSGCDSMVTLNLTVLNPLASSFSVTTCDQYTFNSTLLTSSGSYNDTLVGTLGCDSIVTLNLTINNAQTNTFSQTACDEYLFNGTLLTASGTYVDTLSTFNGCDSIVTVNLTINTVNNSVSQAGTVLTANAFGASYQWLDCNNGFAIIPSETNMVFNTLANGSYAVEVVENGCTDTSGCFTVNTFGIEDESENLLVIYPNPTDGWLKVQINGNQPGLQNIELMNVNGQVLQTIVIHSSNIDVDLRAYPAGIYLIRAVNSIHTKVYRVLKK
jgi:Concanavalin A-like lectin/glucanases superfamily/Secretion system C-terminal sorting domain